MSLEVITAKTRAFAAARLKLGKRLAKLRDMQQAIARRRLPGILTALSEANEAATNLRGAIDVNRPLFTKPRSQTIEGVKVGLQKAPDAIAVANEDETIALIRKHLTPEQVNLLIKTEVSVVKDRLKSLTDEQLVQIGCARVIGSDNVIIKPQDSDLEKLLEMILKESEKDNAAAGAAGGEAA